MTGVGWGNLQRQDWAGPILFWLTCGVVGVLIAFVYLGVSVTDDPNWWKYLLAAVGGSAVGKLIESRHEPHWGPKA